MLTGLSIMIALAATAVFSSKAAWEMYKRFADASVAAAAAEAQLKAIEAQFASTTAQAQALQTERGQEEVLRQRYGVARPGEGEITIVRDQEIAEVPTQEGFFVKLWEALFVW